jgi:hypothetical protein
LVVCGTICVLSSIGIVTYLYHVHADPPAEARLMSFVDFGSHFD